MNTVRKKIGLQFSQVLRNHISPNNITDDFLQRTQWAVRVPPLKFRKGNNAAHKLQVILPFNRLKKCGLAPHLQWDDFQCWFRAVVEDSQKLGTFQRITVAKDAFQIDVNSEEFVKDVLTDISTSESLGNLCSDLFKYKATDDYFTEYKQHQNIVVEYSSPNIAKLFHAGHLRSTVLGNVLSNMYEYLGHNVTRINYLGDWGTQFGYIGVGLNKYFNEIEVNQSPIHHYYNVYVKANQDALSDSSVHSQAMEFFKKMEQGSSHELNIWKQCRDASIQEYQDTYKRLGVRFDVYDGESMYQGKSIDVVKKLKSKGMLKTDSETGVQFVEYPNERTDNGKTRDYKISVLKSDGSTLYLTRDIAAAIDRLEKYNCDSSLYVVENGQHQHFEHLLLILRKLGYQFAEKTSMDNLHIKFGRVEGMKSRSGNVVFLKDILDTAKENMKESLQSRKTTKKEILADGDLFDSICDTLAVSAIIVQDLKENRLHNYKFDWQRMVQFKGDSGVFLQYTHARLCSLIRQTCNVQLISEAPSLRTLLPNCDTSLLQENEALRVIQALAKYDEALYNMYVQLQPYHLVHYLFNLCHLTSKALDCLYVKGQPENIANARLLMFQSVHLVLAEGLKILSITPLEKM